jgi:transaldolase/glucose-6-phosphate isomerase
VFGITFGHRAGWPQLHVLDSTDPQQIKTFENAVDLPKTLVIVSSKSGSTLEPNILKAYFWARMSEAVGPEKVGQHFVAITDPGSHMQKVAEADKFRRIFYGNAQIGGRYSVLSNFGLVPAAAIGIDIRAFLKSTLLMVQSCSPGSPPLANPGVVLGVILGEAQRAGHDKVTIVASPGIADLGAWLEQLLAESTGKQGRGLVPIDGEELGEPGVYGNDRLFVQLHANDAPDAAQDAALKVLEKAGQPVVRVTLNGHQEIGQQFFLWEFATAVAGSIIGIDAFDQPDVEASKIKTRELTDAFNKTGKLPDESPFATFDGVQLFADAKNAEALKGGSLVEVLKAHFARVKAGDYIGLLAYVERNDAHRAALQSLRQMVRDRTHAAVAAEFGPRFLHSTGQAYKGGPNSGVFLQITADDAHDLAVPGESYTFSTVKAAQARGDFDVLAERGRRALRVHLGADVAADFTKLHEAISAALG